MKAAYRTAQNFVLPALVYMAVYESLPDDMDDKIKDAVADIYQKRIWSNEFQDVASFTA